MYGKSDAWACVVLSDADKERAEVFASDRGLTLTELLCLAVTAREDMLSHDKTATLAVELCNLAGRDYNEAAWAANVCARRYAFRVASKRDALTRCLRMLRTCEHMAGAARRGLADLSELTGPLERTRWVIVRTRRNSEEKMGGAGVSFRLSKELKGQVLSSAEALGISASAWLRGALVAYMMDCEAGEEWGRAVLVTDRDVRRLTLAMTRWSVNHRQAADALERVRSAQEPSRFDPRKRTERAWKACDAAKTAMEETWAAFNVAMDPLTTLFSGADPWRS